MTKLSRVVGIAIALLLGAHPVLAQPAAGRGQQAPQAPRVVSPEVFPDKKVTFRLSAPKASEVVLNGSWDNGTDIPMTKDELKPMIVVMPNGNANQIVAQGHGYGPIPRPAPPARGAGPAGGARGGAPAGGRGAAQPYEGSFPHSLVADVVPFIDKTSYHETPGPHLFLIWRVFLGDFGSMLFR